MSFLEIHAENYMCAGGPPHRWLSALREHYGLSVHGVGLSLGGDEAPDPEHLEALARVVDRYQPHLVSEHLAWSAIDGTYLNDLLPIPYTRETLGLVCQHVDVVQQRLGRQILVENPSASIAYAESDWSESDFLAEITRRTGCGILLDVNNLYVCERNLGWDAEAYLAQLPAVAIHEIHLAGHHVERIGESEIRIDDHGSAVCDAVWALYRRAVQLFGRRPTLIEWDNAVPDLPVLLAEAARADQEASEAVSEGTDVDAITS